MPSALRGAGFHPSNGPQARPSPLLSHRSPIRHLPSAHGPSAHRRRGLSRAVITEAITRAQAWPGLAAIQLGISDHPSEAQSLYLKLGFFSIGHDPDAIGVNGRSFAENAMRLAL